MIITLKSPFSAAHFYAQPQWDEHKNRETFGRCYTQYGHGHNYMLEAGFHCQNDSWKQQQQHYQSVLNNLTAVLDHEHLNFVIPEFKTNIPTTENICLYFLEKLKSQVKSEEISYLRLYEMDNIWTEIRL
ncbi:6-carboxytetrahydropterin synthase [Bdellovibrio bacteriovorus]|uniref:6-carboxy-5,6,7,8-tetrahydropterin synthase n=1 Tax=Bdellovibrio bacteriovorus (strain ATCC 15356 / DSM 50701 / NCIMB 9529 / HD100) TaxID=264462 RepID=Q6MLN9_BDEBA|nr:6-carboxytetrahydropterin synthase [Bdellovibrio bacteriovorus]CAE79818.1 6-pyruvoyltetrahydropterin synthase [Bdellovibrio bacteriovorus HD100]